MALRLIEIIVPESQAAPVVATLAADPLGGPWQQALAGGLCAVRVLLDAERSGPLVDEIESRHGSAEGFHLMILPVQAALPRPPEEEQQAEPPPPRLYGSKQGGLSREELLAEARDMARPSRVFMATVVLSTAVVSIGLLRDNTAAIIGAMVIAPLLGPNVALALATTLADATLLRLGLRASAVGLAVALVITIVLGAVIPLRVPTSEIQARTIVHYSDILLALAAGSAGALALTTGVPIALVGVMVAVALLPPTAVVGLMLGRGEAAEAGGAALLLLVNVLCVNLAAMVTFRVQGIAPRTWWEADRARRAARTATAIGVALVAVLTIVVFLARRG